MIMLLQIKLTLPYNLSRLNNSKKTNISGISKEVVCVRAAQCKYIIEEKVKSALAEDKRDLEWRYETDIHTGTWFAVSRDIG